MSDQTTESDRYEEDINSIMPASTVGMFRLDGQPMIHSVEGGELKIVDGIANSVPFIGQINGKEDMEDSTTK
ncbi:MAG: hypothetical protein Hyperionvirus13_12 [Hyperionvirus sp.]|uniref:Uncharacterized protein n=1 Tax=Hyperionvirus sp. TaxID=2487770 RepID=A0A3G5A9D0_9VIRU|nr:MAG: hypothetical protein Hyperionvirus13_12 [Hyperionvirus sp.]